MLRPERDPTSQRLSTSAVEPIIPQGVRLGTGTPGLPGPQSVVALTWSRRPPVWLDRARVTRRHICQDDGPADLLTILDPSPESSYVGDDLVQRSPARFRIAQLRQEAAGVPIGRLRILQAVRVGVIPRGQFVEQAGFDGPFQPHPQVVAICAGIGFGHGIDPRAGKSIVESSLHSTSEVDGEPFFIEAVPWSGCNGRLASAPGSWLDSREPPRRLHRSLPTPSSTPRGGPGWYCSRRSRRSWTGRRGPCAAGPGGRPGRDRRRARPG